jgi:hypothetical protein
MGARHLFWPVRSRALLFLLCLAAMVPVRAAQAAPPAALPADCRTLAAAAEPEFGIPEGLLQSMAMVETGIYGMAWPWTINAGGQPYYMLTEADAQELARRAVARYGNEVAMGCMQIYLKWHVDQFRDLQEVLQPVANVRYAAAYLVSLRRRYGSWVKAVQHYHASDPGAQLVYLCKVIRTRVSLGFQGVSADTARACAGAAPIPGAMVAAGPADGGAPARSASGPQREEGHDQ